MRRYESVFIVNPELSEEQREPLLDKLKSLLSEDQGMLVKFDEWGHRRLAYEIKKQTRGYYVLMEFCGDGDLVKEIERNMRLDDRVLKYMTVLKDTTVDVEALKAEIEAAKEQELQPASEPTEQVADGAEDEPASEVAETVEPMPSETKAAESMPETIDEEEAKNGTTKNGAE